MIQKIFSQFSDKIIRYPKVVITIIAVITAVLALGLPKIQLKMGNDVFVNAHSVVYQNTQKAQKSFGGDNAYLLFSAKHGSVINHETFAAIADFEKQLHDVPHISHTTSVITLLNQQLKSTGATKLANNTNLSPTKQHKLQADIMANLSPTAKARIQQHLLTSLTTEQKAQLQTYTLSLLTSTQQLTIAHQGSTANLTSILTNPQQKQLNQYTQQLLTKKQQAQLAQSMLTYLPSVEKMSTSLLQDLILDNGHVNSNLATLLPKDGQHLLLLATLDKADMDSDVELINALNKTINQHPIKNITIRVAGQPAILGNISGEVMTTMAIMLGLAVIMMVLILALVFHVRRRLLSLLFVLIGLIWSFGIMGWFNISLTLATMATLPILIGLGTDFGVQFQNRYEEEYRKHPIVTDAIKQAIVAMGPGVGSALLVMMCTFLTMFLSKAPLMQQFGLTLAIGVLAVYIVEFFLMFATLRLLDRKNIPVKATHQNNFISKLLAIYARFVTQHAFIVVLLGIVVGIAGFTVEHNIPVETDLTNMIPKKMSALENTKYLQKQVGSTNYITYLVEAPNVTRKSTLLATDKLTTQIVNKHADIIDATTITSTYHQMFGSFTTTSQPQINANIASLPAALRQQMISRNHHYAMIQFKVGSHLSSADQNKLMKRITREFNTATAHQNYQIVPAGAQVLMLVGLDNISSNRTLMMLAGIMVIVILLTLIYRRFSHALLPAFPIIVVLGVSPLTLYLLGQSYNPLTLGLSALVLGIGTEFTILIIERYREELMQGQSVREAVIQAVQSVGQAITVSGLTVIGGFFAIIFVSFPVLSSFGLITVLDTAFSLLAALTLLPAIIVLTQGKVDNKLSPQGIVTK